MNISSDPKKVLIVDDDKYVRMYMSRALTHSGLKIYSASNGFEALESVTNNTPDIIILNLLMPGLNGFDFCRSYRTFS